MRNFTQKTSSYTNSGQFSVQKNGWIRLQKIRIQIIHTDPANLFRSGSATFSLSNLRTLIRSGVQTYEYVHYSRVGQFFRVQKYSV